MRGRTDEIGGLSGRRSRVDALRQSEVADAEVGYRMHRAQRRERARNKASGLSGVLSDHHG
jgi:hypothetical protein